MFKIGLFKSWITILEIFDKNLSTAPLKNEDIEILKIFEKYSRP